MWLMRRSGLDTAITHAEIAVFGPIPRLWQTQAA
jgi:hypothetical protein